jgi:hypothetical protein
MPAGTIDEARILVEKWMDNRYPKKDFLASDLDNFRYAAETALGIGFSVHQPKGHVDFVLVRARIVFDPNHVSKISSLDAKAREEFLWELKEKLLFWPPHFEFEFDKSKIPTAIKFYAEISFDELTIGKLQDAINQITRCLLWVAWYIAHRFGIQDGE